MTALDADQRRDPPGLVDSTHVAGARRKLESRGIARGDATHDVDLFQRRLDCRSTAQRRRDVDRPELPADVSGAQARDVGLKRMLELARVGSEIDCPPALAVILPQLLGPVVMPVDQRRRGQEAGDASARGGGSDGDRDEYGEERGGIVDGA